jgi:hypothetical protein
VLLLCVAGGVGPSSARADEGPSEFWPEVQLHFRLNPRTQILFNSAPNRSLESGEKTSAEYGLYLDYKPVYHRAYRIGYMYSLSPAPASGGSDIVEHRMVLDYSYGWPIGRTGMLWDRTRIDLRDRDGEFSQRIRNRVRYLQTLRIERKPVTAFVDAELFYDTRFDAISRYKFQIGANIPISPTVELTPYLGRQIDTKPATKSINGLGLVLGLHF